MRRSLTKDERLRAESDIQRVFDSPATYRCKGLQMKMVRNDLGYNRALVVPTRKSGKAVRKNRQRRIGREIFRNLKHNLQPGYDLVFILYPGDFSYSEREKQFHTVLSKADLLRFE